MFMVSYGNRTVIWQKNSIDFHIKENGVRRIHMAQEYFQAVRKGKNDKAGVFNIDVSSKSNHGDDTADK